MMEFHPTADIFPMMHPEAFEVLADDIKANGLLEPISLYEGKVLDGRNREKACDKVGVKPRYTTYKGDDPLAFVLSMNMKRRHLDESQRAMVGHRIEGMKHGRPSAKNANLHLIDRATAAKMVNVSSRSIADAAKVGAGKYRPLIRAVDDGKIAVSLAAKLAEQDEETQAAAVADPDKAVHLLKQKIRQDHVDALDRQIRELPTKKFVVILADPEWQFLPWNEETGSDRSAANHYATSRLQDIKARDVPSIAADNCVLFLWATTPLLPQALEVMEAWGFEYKSHCIWLKDRVGTGYWFRSVHELLLIGTKGHPPAPAPGTQCESAWDAPVGEHSEKPQFAFELIERYFPNLPKIELNARKKRDGWDHWGAEAPLDLEAAAS